MLYNKLCRFNLLLSVTTLVSIISTARLHDKSICRDPEGEKTSRYHCHSRHQHPSARGSDKGAQSHYFAMRRKGELDGTCLRGRSSGRMTVVVLKHHELSCVCYLNPCYTCACLFLSDESSDIDSFVVRRSVRADEQLINVME